MAATPTRRCDDWDAIGRAIRWAGRTRQIVAGVGGAVAFLLGAIGIMEIAEAHFERDIAARSRDYVNQEILRRAATSR